MADNIRATPQNPYTGALARGLRSLQQLAGQYQVDPRIPLLGGTSVDELLSLPGAASLAEDVSYYGPRALIRGGNVATGGIGTFKLDPRVADVADVAMNVTPLAAIAGRTATRGAMAAGRAGERLAERVVPQVMERGGIGAQLMQDMATGSRSQVVKPKGGNWLAGSVERAVEPMRARFDMGAGLRVDPATINREGLDARQLEMLAPTDAMNRWLETKLGKYIRNEMATPEDPLRALAERGVMHAEIGPTGYSLKGPRAMAGFPEEGVGVSPLAKTWEDRADTFINQLHASDLTRGYPETVDANPWLAKVPPQTRVYEMLRGAEEDLGFTHLADELRNAINPASGLPENLRWKYQDLDKVTVPQAVERVAKINEWRAAQKAEADMARAMNPATHVFKEYPEQGFKWVELRQPKELPEGWTEARKPSGEVGAYYDPSGATVYDHPGRKTLEDALKYEGETMGHCVGGYCPDVIEGRSKIYSLRDKKGQPHVTIEVQPGLSDAEIASKESNMKLIRGANFRLDDEARKNLQTPEIIQIKGKANRAPNPEYLPAVQDFVRSQNWSNVGDLQNTGLMSIEKVPEKRLYEAAGMKLPKYVTEKERDELINEYNRLTVGPTDPNFMSEAYGFPPPKGFANGGQVHGFAEGGLVGGANFPTYDFDPARIDAIVDELHALNAG